MDQSAWRAAARAGFKTGGWMPRGWVTLDGPRPEFAGLYGAREHPQVGYPPRTGANVRDTDATIWLGSGDSAGYRCTVGACRRLNRPFLNVGDRDSVPAPWIVAEWIESHMVRRLNCAGSRETDPPWVGAWAEEYLSRLFEFIKNN